MVLECPIAVSELNIASIAIKMRIFNNQHEGEYAESEVCEELQTFAVCWIIHGTAQWPITRNFIGASSVCVCLQGGPKGPQSLYLLPYDISLTEFLIPMSMFARQFQS